MKKITLLLLSVLLFSCQKESKTTDNKLTVNLEFKVKNKPLSLSSQSKNFLFLDSIPKGFKGVVENDSTLLGYMTIIYKSQLQKFATKKGLSVKDFEHIQTKIYCLSGYKNGKQFFILDTNKNKDFSDDEIFEFDKNLSQLLKTYKVSKNTLPIYDIVINDIIGDEIIERRAALLVYPQAGKYYTNTKTKRPLLKKKLKISAKLREYLYGEFEIEDKNFKVGLSKYGFKGIELQFREKDSVFYTYSDYRFSNYSISDTIKFNSSFYSIDTVSIIPPKMVLKKLSMSEKIFGFRLGDKIRNYSTTDLDGKSTDLKSLFKDNEYLLVDFWGTWCAPCKELTPKLVSLDKVHKDKISLVSFAYQLEVEPIKKYVKSNKMNWYHGIIKGMPKSSKNKPAIIKQLRVEAFPTFLLLDKNLNIVYRTSGNGASFDNMVKFIAKIK